MPETPRSPWSWTPRSTALVMTGTLLTAAWVAVGATMMLSERPSAPAAAPPAQVESTPAAKRAVAPKREAAASRSQSRYNPKPYKGPLPKSGTKAPVAVAHPPQVETSQAAADAQDPQQDGPAHTWPSHHGNHDGGPRHHGGGHRHWW
ncbi:hypothetical protein [Nocardioides sp.]|uniref:hypothetical protein n=1 Tax=Nocardioides sp. TaxID=35761 RepID=UPI003D11B25B